MRRLIGILLLLSAWAGLWAVQPSGTLPVLYITTDGKQEVSRDYYVDATIYVVGQGEYPNLGDKDHPLPISIRGRGNWTWSGFDKKPYKILFGQGQGQKLLGMHKSKHWALMAGADDYLGFMKNIAGYYVSEQVGLPYTPQQVPCELVLNGDYKGLYFVTENIRIDNDRVNIKEQQDGETDAELITGGWLVEIDNYPSEGNITFNEHNGAWVMVSLHSPENLSGIQREYISDQLHALNDAIYDQGKPLHELLDLTDAARFYLVQEIMANRESYHGSCYLYKDRDSTDASGRMVLSKWHFGPVWDFGNSYDDMSESTIYEQMPWPPQVWIEQLCQNKIFYERTMQVWHTYRNSGHQKVLNRLSRFVEQITEAAKRDGERWKDSENVRNNSNMAERSAEFFSRMNRRVNWLYSKWGEGDSTPIPDGVENVNSDNSDTPKRATIRIENGQLIIERDGKIYTPTGIIKN